MFADADRLCEKRQLGISVGILIGDLIEGSLFHVLTWSSHLSKRAVKSIGASEKVATSAAIDKVILISAACSRLLETPVSVLIVVDSKHLFESLKL